VTLLKSSHDGHGHLFGSHENYEATVGVGAELMIWRVALFFALPLMLIIQILTEMVALLLIVAISVPELIWCGLALRRPGRYHAAVIHVLLSVCYLPLTAFGRSFVSVLAFRRVRNDLLPFLVTRTIFTGPGMIQSDGHFVLSPRAERIGAECSTGTLVWRSVFQFGQISKAIVGKLAGDQAIVDQLFRQRQRLQIVIGDSNMAQFAEYLKLGTTQLVLDAIEAGQLPKVPRLKRPIEALRAISDGADFRSYLPLTDGGAATAMQIQRYYLNACRRFVKSSANATHEAHEIVALWQQTLDALETDPTQLIGKIDWVTKKYLLDGIAADATIDEKRKLDLRYHELSKEGYYLRLEGFGAASMIVEPADIMSAMDTAPEGTPATKRGQLIREYAADPGCIKASWSTVIVPRKWIGSRTIRLN
jgi:proteasome accessory factor A